MKRQWFSKLEPYRKFGEFGGQFVPEALMPALGELEEAYNSICTREEYQTEYEYMLKTYVGRPTPLTYAARLTNYCGGAKIYLKREDLAHTGAHKINNSIGQALLAKKMGKTRVVAETGAGQHGVAVASACALFGLRCTIYMGSIDMARQAPNVYRMKLLGAEVQEVDSNSKTLKDAINDAIRDWVSNLSDTYYLLGSAIGPHPYPSIVCSFQSIIGSELREQIQSAENRLPDTIIACVGGGSNSLGIFHEFLHENVILIGVEAGGKGIKSGQHSTRLSSSEGRPGVLHGCYTYVLQDENGQVGQTHSVSAGLDYPAIGPEHSFLMKEKRVSYTYVEDHDAIAAFKTLCQLEGIIPALEPSHAIAFAINYANTLNKNKIIVINLSGRGDKDIETITNSSDTLFSPRLGFIP